MNILDTSFEENSFIIDGYTLEYKTNEWGYPTHIKTGKPKYPYYVGVKNKTGVHVPTNTVKGISPFEMSNPKLNDLFGLHVYNKPFGFQDMQIIPSVNNYPYYGNDVNKHGLYYSYDGLVTGYVLNGVSEEDIKLTNGNKELKVHTINEDDITNSETKRVIYTPKDNNEVLPYGPYYKVETYFYGVNGSAEYSPSGKTTFYYKDGEKYIQIQPQDVKWGEHNNEYYIFVKATKENNLGVDGYQRISKYVDAGVDGIIQIYDENGMIYYIKQGNSYVRNDSISSYQYAVISNDNNTLHLTDGYGEDVEINLNEGYDRLYPTDIIITDKLKINKEQVDYYDEFYIFKNPTPTLVPVVEDVYKIIDTSNSISDLINEITVTSDEVNYKINIVVHKAVFKIKDENLNDKTIFIEYTYKLDDNTFKVIDRELKDNGYNLSISCNNNLSYKKPFDESNVKTIINNFLDVIIGEDISKKNKDYKINEVDGGREVSIVINNTDSNNNIILNGNVNLGNITNIGGKILAPDYVYNRVDKIVYEKNRITQKKEVFILDKEGISNNPEVYITLDVGSIGYIGTIIFDEDEEVYQIVIDYSEKEIDINGLTYSYNIKKITDSEGNDIKYYYNSNEINYFPETPQLLLNIFYGDYVGYDNEIPTSNVVDKDLYYIYNNINGDNDDIDYVFMLCKKTIDNVIYYSYSPKICVNKPKYEIIYTDDKTKIHSVIIDVSNNEYLKNYNCKIDRVQKYGVSEETILESWEINPNDNEEKKDVPIVLEYNQNIIVNPIENEKINIYDCTGLKLEELDLIKNETEEN